MDRCSVSKQGSSRLMSNPCDVVGRRYTHLQEQVTKQTYQVAALQKALQRTQDEVLTDTHPLFAVSLCTLIKTLFFA